MVTWGTRQVSTESIFIDYFIEMFDVFSFNSVTSIFIISRFGRVNVIMVSDFYSQQKVDGIPFTNLGLMYAYLRYKGNVGANIAHSLNLCKKY